MNRALIALIICLCLFVTACGTRGGQVPRNLDNACPIIEQRPQYLRAMARAESRWGVPVAVQMATIHQESSFIADARSPLRYVLGIIPSGRISSAYGYGQALDGTWQDYLREQGRWRARRDNIRDAPDFIG